MFSNGLPSRTLPSCPLAPLFGGSIVLEQTHRVTFLNFTISFSFLNFFFLVLELPLLLNFFMSAFILVSEQYNDDDEITVSNNNYLLKNEISLLHRNTISKGHHTLTVWKTWTRKKKKLIYMFSLSLFTCWRWTSHVTSSLVFWACRQEREEGLITSLLQVCLTFEFHLHCYLAILSGIGVEMVSL